MMTLINIVKHDRAPLEILGDDYIPNNGVQA